MLAFRSRSGAIDGRPMSEYMPANAGLRAFSASSVIARTRRIGWFRGTSSSGVMLSSIAPCSSSRPRIVPPPPETTIPHLAPYADPFFNTLLEVDERVGNALAREDAAGGL